MYKYIKIISFYGLMYKKKYIFRGTRPKIKLKRNVRMNYPKILQI